MNTVPYASISGNEFLLFQDYVLKLCGISIPPEKAYLFETRLSKLMMDAGVETFHEYHAFLKTQDDPGLRQRIINAITTIETLWFRDEPVWACMEQIVLPRLVADLASGKKKRVRVWSAAASTGQEAYSAVMCVDKYLKKNPGISLSHFEFIATDISTKVLEIATRGRYDRISIARGLNEAYRTEYFTHIDAAWELDPRIRDAVTFRQFDLQNEYHQFGAFDIILCRYVLIYFPDHIKMKTVKKMCGALTGDGVLFIGNYALFDIFKDDFDANHFRNISYYTKRMG
jgi:chemotaxis protein methyltransferase CheR